MERLITRDLLAWKDDPGRKPLVLTGVRQCGKTYICKDFGQRHFPDVAYCNFEDDRRLASIFSYDYDVERILRELGTLIFQRQLQPGSTLVILDEIQSCPAAISCLKYFYENMPTLHVIAAGSLLGVTIRQHQSSFPVGKVDFMTLRPMSFLEFLWADLGVSYEQGIRNYPLDGELPEAYTAPLEKALRQYYMVGGMPEAVAKWTSSHNMAQVEKIQDAILSGYALDFAKYAPKNDIPKIGWIWDSIPNQLAKENRKFIFSHVKEGKRSADLEDALHWLLDAGMASRLTLVEQALLPLSMHKNDTYFKIYFCDVGLLRKKAGVPWKAFLTEDGSYSDFRGAITENFVMNELLALGLTPYFWRSGNTAELDFLLDYDGRCIPIEAKATIHTRAKSYRQFAAKYQPPLGFKFSMKNVGRNLVEATDTYSLPLYTLWRLVDYLEM